MMYHFMFGFLGASVAASAASGAFVSTASAAFASTCSLLSLILFSSISRFGALRLTTFSIADELPRYQRAESPIQTAADDAIHDPEISGEDEDRNDDDCGRRLNFFARRRCHLAHLVPDITEEAPGAARQAL